MSLPLFFWMGAILAEIPAFEGATTAGRFSASVPRLTWPARRHHDIVIECRARFPTRPTDSFSFSSYSPYELDGLGGGTGCVAFDRLGGRLPVRPFHRRRGGSDNVSELIPRIVDYPWLDTDYTPTYPWLVGYNSHRFVYSP
jgi:hypothetical protein